MNKDFYQQIANCNISRKSRENNRDFTLSHPEYLPDLAEIGLNPNDENHHKALWVFELICEKHPELFINYINTFCQSLSKYSNEQAIRPAAKICYFLCQSPKILLSETQTQSITEACFTWLIGEHKAAPKAFAIYTLSELALNDNWIRHELKSIIEKDYHNQTASFRAATRNVLKKLSK